MSLVNEIPPASPAAVEARYALRLTFETDCWDVHDSMRTAADFVLLDVRGPKLYEVSHVPGAINLPHGKMTASRMAEWPSGRKVHCLWSIAPDRIATGPIVPRCGSAASAARSR